MIANRGLPEMEALRTANGGAELALTLLRCVGWLSRDDFPTRQGQAGPQLPTPGAQCPGRHRIEVSLRLHRDDDPRRIAEAHGFAFPPLAFPGVEDADGVIADGARLVAVDDPQVLVSAVEPCGDGDADLRLVNASGDTRSLHVAWGAPTRSLRIVDLAGRDDGAASFELDSTNAGSIARFIHTCRSCSLASAKSGSISPVIQPSMSSAAAIRTRRVSNVDAAIVLDSPALMSVSCTLVELNWNCIRPVNRTETPFACAANGPAMSSPAVQAIPASARRISPPRLGFRCNERETG